MSILGHRHGQVINSLADLAELGESSAIKDQVKILIRGNYPVDGLPDPTWVDIYGNEATPQLPAVVLYSH